MREGPRLHVLPDNPHLLALGEERLVGTDPTVSWGNVRYCTPDGHELTQAMQPRQRSKCSTTVSVNEIVPSTSPCIR